ncbi:hypothetical protein [Jiella mangrovi]|nr:hypothetical protein [Jiella mangrovi]
MLADILIGRSSCGGDRDRDDLHRHATFNCGIKSFFKRAIRLFRFA